MNGHNKVVKPARTQPIARPGRMRRSIRLARRSAAAIMTGVILTFGHTTGLGQSYGQYPVRILAGPMTYHANHHSYYLLDRC